MRSRHFISSHIFINWSAIERKVNAGMFGVWNIIACNSYFLKWMNSGWLRLVATIQRVKLIGKYYSSAWHLSYWSIIILKLTTNPIYKNVRLQELRSLRIISLENFFFAIESKFIYFFIWFDFWCVLSPVVSLILRIQALVINTDSFRNWFKRKMGGSKPILSGNATDDIHVCTQPYHRLNEACPFIY